MKATRRAFFGGLTAIVLASAAPDALGQPAPGASPAGPRIVHYDIEALKQLWPMWHKIKADIPSSSTAKQVEKIFDALLKECFGQPGGIHFIGERLRGNEVLLLQTRVEGDQLLLAFKMKEPVDLSSAAEPNAGMGTDFDIVLWSGFTV